MSEKLSAKAIQRYAEEGAKEQLLAVETAGRAMIEALTEMTELNALLRRWDPDYLKGALQTAEKLRTAFDTEGEEVTA
jgi:hypothetical protein